MSMNISSAIVAILDHKDVHHIGEYPHIRIGEALDMAIAALREKEERENPQPLTFEELQQLQGEPVWLHILNPKPWQDKLMLVEVCEIRTTKYCTFWAFGNECELDFNPDEYGKTWTAYRHKPKEVPDDA